MMREAATTNVPALLTEPQARSLTAGVHRLDDILVQLDHLLDAASATSPAPQLVADIAPASITWFQGAVATLRTELNALAALLGVEPERRSVRRTVAALASSAWTIAEDLRPAELTGYGVMHAAAADTLTPHLERIAAGFLALAQQANETDREPHERDSP